jgi:intracellular septation protein
MKFLFDFLPIILFFVAYKLGNAHPDAAQGWTTHYLGALVAGGAVTADQAPILLASFVAIAATVLQVGFQLVRGRKVDGMLWLSLAVIVIMGGATIYFHEKVFILWKPTILYWAFALALVVARFGFGKNLMRSAMEKQLKLPDAVWDRVAYTWMLFFAVLGLLNLFMAFVVFKDNTSAWVNFKVFGITGIFFAFVIAQTLMLSKYIQEDA